MRTTQKLFRRLTLIAITFYAPFIATCWAERPLNSHEGQVGELVYNEKNKTIRNAHLRNIEQKTKMFKKIKPALDKHNFKLIDTIIKKEIAAQNTKTLFDYNSLKAQIEGKKLSTTDSLVAFDDLYEQIKFLLKNKEIMLSDPEKQEMLNLSKIKGTLTNKDLVFNYTEIQEQKKKDQLKDDTLFFKFKDINELSLTIANELHNFFDSRRLYYCEFSYEKKIDEKKAWRRLKRMGNKEVFQAIKDENPKKTVYAHDIEDIESWPYCWAPLHYYANKGDLDVVRFICEHAPCINPRDMQRLTPLYYAQKNNHKEVVDYLKLQGGYNSLEESEKLLQYLDEKKFKEASKMINSERIEINRQIPNHKKKWTLLHHYVDRENREVIDYLLRKGADPEIKDSDSLTPRRYAVKKENYLLANLWITKPYNKKTKEKLLKYIDNNQMDDAREVLDQIGCSGINAPMPGNKDGWTLMHYYAHKCRPDIVRILYFRNAFANSLDKNGRTPFELFPANLLEHRANQEKSIICKWHDLTYLMPDETSDDYQIMLDIFLGALEKNDFERAHDLERRFAIDLEEELPGRNLKLMNHYAMKGKEKIIMYLLSRGSCPRMCDKHDRLPIDYISNSTYDTIKKLLTITGSMYYTRKNGGMGKKPHLFVIKNLIDPLDNHCKKATESIKKYEINVNAPLPDDKDNWTLMHLCAALGTTKAVEFLVKQGAKTNCKDKKGCTPYDYALKYKKYETATALKRYEKKS